MQGKASGLCGHAGGHGITPAHAGKSIDLIAEPKGYKGSPPRVRGKVAP